MNLDVRAQKIRFGEALLKGRTKLEKLVRSAEQLLVEVLGKLRQESPPGRGITLIATTSGTSTTHS